MSSTADTEIAVGTTKRPSWSPKSVALCLQFAWVPLVVYAFSGYDRVTDRSLILLTGLFFLAMGAACGIVCRASDRLGARMRAALVAVVTGSTVAGVALFIAGHVGGLGGFGILAAAIALLGLAQGATAGAWLRALTPATDRDAAGNALLLVVACAVVTFAVWKLPSPWFVLLSVLQVVSVAMIPEPSAVDDRGVRRTKLLEVQTRKLVLRCVAAFGLVGLATGTMACMFMGTPYAIPNPNLWYLVLAGIPVFGIIMLIAWLRHREFNGILAFGISFVAALLAFFPLDPGTPFSLDFSVGFTILWGVALLGCTLMVELRVDRPLCGWMSPTGLCVVPLCMGIALGALAASVSYDGSLAGKVASFVVVDSNMGACVRGLMSVAAVFYATNVALRESVIREVELTAHGKIQVVTDLPDEVPADVADKMDPAAAGSTVAVAIPGFETGCTSVAAAGIAAPSVASAATVGASSLSLDGTDGPSPVPDVPKPFSIDEACRRIAFDYALTPRELEVFSILAHGNTLARVQEELIISEGTAHTHRRNLYTKLDVHSRQELVDLVEHYRTPTGGTVA